MNPLLKNFFGLRHFLVIAICKILKWNLECIMIVQQGEKIIVETVIWKGNKIIGEYTLI
jgi:hypothetical protein